MIDRQLATLVVARLRAYPAVALVGPRQSGKTTLARTLGGSYYDLEKEADRLRLDVEWDSVVKGRQLAVFDEAQEMPALFARLRTAIDEDRKRNDRFLLLGSVSPALMRQVGESLAGRLALCELTPLLAGELPAKRWDDLWRFGGYPDGGVLDAGRFSEWQQFYLDLLAQRDLPHWGLPARAAVLQRLFRMLAVAHGQTWNASQLGKSLGLSYHTVNHYADFLEQAFLVRRLPAFSANLRKRLVKAPKFYWRDSGLLHALLEQRADSDLLSQPWVGASWEGWIIEQMLGRLAARGMPHQAYYLRTSDQHEIDLLLECAGRRYAFEIKLTSAPAAFDLESLGKKAALVKAHAHYLVSRTRQPTTAAGRGSIDLTTCFELLDAL
ncbi:MAG: ATP-binding protein [Verrucomicrobia bacterium]|nr:ATP-binding protein [Verrucomicrobiota bacterium]